MAEGPQVLVAVPAAPLLLEALSAHQPEHLAGAVERLRRETRGALHGIAGCASVLLVVAGPHTVVHAPRRATFGPLGRPEVVTALVPARQVANALATALGCDVVEGTALHGDAAVLAAQAAAEAPDTAVCALEVPMELEDNAIAEVVRVIADSAVHGVVAASDLAATLDEHSPGYRVEGAADWDRDVTDAVRRLDASALAVLGPGGARAHHARGWIPLRVLVSLATGRGADSARVGYHAPDGVGQLVVTVGAP